MVDTLVYAINEARQTGIKTALVSIIATQGSTPRKAGASMLVYPDGRVLGTIGGGCAEAEARLQALTALNDNESFICRLSMSAAAAANEGMACGGNMEVFIQVV